MTFQEYQKLAMRTMPDLPREMALCNAALGLCGEIGELMECDEEQEFEEAGDMLWYCAYLAELTGVKLDIDPDKITDRLPCDAHCKIAEAVKKHVFHEKILHQGSIELWISLIAHWACSFDDPAQIMTANITKLKARYPKGFPK